MFDERKDQKREQSQAYQLFNHGLLLLVSHLLTSAIYLNIGEN